MYSYYLRLAIHSLRKNPVLTALMIGAIAIGIGVSRLERGQVEILDGLEAGERIVISNLAQFESADNVYLSD